MHGTQTSAVVAALVGLSMAAPAEVAGKKAFSVEQVAAGPRKALHPAQSMLNTYAKYGKLDAAPAEVKAAAAAAAQSGTVPANPEDNDVSYLSPVTVGGKVLNLDFDTGSSDLWVYSTLQASSQTSGHSVYNPSTSGTLKSGYTWKISYGDGSGAAGRVYADKVVVGGVTATSQAVEAATSISAQFVADTDNDGLLGLAFSSINTVSPQKQTTFFDTVKSSLAAPLFTVRLRKGAAGTYDFGFIDSSKYSGAITYVPVNNGQGFWGFTAGGYQIGSGAAVSTSIGSAIADTGTTLLYLPSSVVTAYYRQVSSATFDNDQGGYVVSCSATLPNFTVKIGTGSFVVPGSYINYAPIGNGQCFGGIQSNTGIGLTIFGDIFLKAVFAVFDQSTGSPRLGFATGK
ncbi:aspartic protease SNP2 [Elsinoe australis]|uniref:Aspartic protease SNP2 n=1 Tax=Elsinoe australis TaxID=40998 RepID=A0A2P7ZD17_9PEZI|nr:Pepsin A [Elsinoe australis]TKX18931.1 aspartic protease SNP2 [Elsinoe australis]